MCILQEFYEISLQIMEFVVKKSKVMYKDDY